MQLAAKAIDQQPIEEREYNAFCLNVKKSDIAKAKEMIRDFKNEFIQRFEAPSGKAESTYQLNMQFFNILESLN